MDHFSLTMGTVTYHLKLLQDVYFKLLYVLESRGIAAALPQFAALHELRDRYAREFCDVASKIRQGMAAADADADAGDSEAFLKQVEAKRAALLGQGAYALWDAMPPEAQEAVVLLNKRLVSVLMTRAVKHFLACMAVCTHDGCTHRAAFACATCKAGYCSKVCQRKAWKEGHALNCEAMRETTRVTRAELRDQDDFACAGLTLEMLHDVWQDVC